MEVSVVAVFISAPNINTERINNASNVFKIVDLPTSQSRSILLGYCSNLKTDRGKNGEKTTKKRSKNIGGSMIKKFIRKPEVVEAVQYDGTNMEEIKDFCNSKNCNFSFEWITISNWICKDTEGFCMKVNDNYLHSLYEEVKG